jgi:hypothetical protein
MRYNKKIFLAVLSIVLPVFLVAVNEPAVPTPVQNPDKQSVWNFAGARTEKFKSSYFAQDTNATTMASLTLLANRYINLYMSDLPPAEKQIMVTCFVTIGSLMLRDVQTCKKPEEQNIPDVQEALKKVYEDVFVYFDEGAARIAAFEKFIDVFAINVESAATLATPDTFAQKIKVLKKDELLCNAPESFKADKKKIAEQGLWGKFVAGVRSIGGKVVEVPKKVYGVTKRWVFSTIAFPPAVVDWMRMPFFAVVVEGMHQGVIVAPSIEDQMHIAQVYPGLLSVEAYVYLRIITDSIVGKQVITVIELMKAQEEGKSEREVSAIAMKLVQFSKSIDEILQKNIEIFIPKDLKKCAESVQQAIQQAIESHEPITAEKLSEISDQTYAHYLLNPKTISTLMYNQQKADKLAQTIQALWEVLLPGEQTAAQLHRFLAGYAPQALTKKQSEEQKPASEVKDTDTIGAESSLPAVPAEGALPNTLAEGALPNMSAEGALPNMSAEGALPNTLAEGALPAVPAEGVLPATSVEGKRQAAGSALPVQTGEKKDAGKMGEFNFGDTKDTYKPYFGSAARPSSSATPSSSGGGSSEPSASGSARGGDRSSSQPARTPSSGAGKPYYGSGAVPYKPSPARPGYGTGSGAGYGTFGGQQQAVSPMAGATASGVKDTKAACWHQSEADDGSLCIDVFTGPFYPAHGEVAHQEEVCIYTKKAVGESKKLCLVEEEKAIQPVPLQSEIKKIEPVKQTTWFTPTVIAWSAGVGVVAILLIILAVFVL